MNMRILLLAFCCLVLSACNGGSDLSEFGEPAPNIASSAPATLNLLVIGGTKGIGLETVQLALSRGHTVTAMARRPERLFMSHERLTKLKGDILDLESVKQAVSGKDAVIVSIGAGPTRKPVTLFSKGTANVLEAMRTQELKRLITVTGIGAGDSRGHGGFFYDNILQPLLLDTIYRDKDIAEQLIADSDSSWTIVRPGFLTDDASEANYRVIADMNGVTSGDISRADVAHFMLAAIEADSYLGATVLLSN
ncbi:MAG: NAD(P)-dependent oxidoreductase [Pseudomonadales bacterium]